MTEDKYTESDEKCCKFLDEIINQKFTCSEERKLLQLIKRILIEFPREELEPIRGKYLVFMKDENNNYQPYDYVLNAPIESVDIGLKGAYLFFVPTENEHCATATMPYRNAVESSDAKCKCFIS